VTTFYETINLDSDENLHPFAKSFNWQFQEEFRGDKRREGRGIAEKILDISSNDEYSAGSLLSNTVGGFYSNSLEEIWAGQLCLSVMS
jgi:hypothetical protein